MIICWFSIVRIKKCLKSIQKCKDLIKRCKPIITWNAEYTAKWLHLPSQISIRIVIFMMCEFNTDVYNLFFFHTPELLARFIFPIFFLFTLKRKDKPCKKFSPGKKNKPYISRDIERVNLDSYCHYFPFRKHSLFRMYYNY